MENEDLPVAKLLKDDVKNVEEAYELILFLNNLKNKRTLFLRSNKNLKTCMLNFLPVMEILTDSTTNFLF
jgi:hypothetical protein